LTGEKLAVAIGAALGGAASWTSHARGGPARGRRSLAAPLERAGRVWPRRTSARPSRLARRDAAAIVCAPPQPLTHVRVVAASPALRAAALATPAHRQSGEARTSPSTSAGGRSVIGWALPRRPRRPCSPPWRETEHRYCRRRRGKRRPLRSCSGSRGGKEHRRVVAAAE